MRLCVCVCEGVGLHRGMVLPHWHLHKAGVAAVAVLAVLRDEDAHC